MGNTKMNKYLVFSGYDFYPSGGFEDFKGSFEDFESAVKFALEVKGGAHDWFQVVDGVTGEIIQQG